MNRKRFELETIPGSAVRAWPCPHCQGKGSLHRESLASYEAPLSKQIREFDGNDWDESRIIEHFSAVLKCDMCPGLVHAVGTTSWVGAQDINDPSDIDWAPEYRPEHFVPALQFIQLPLLCHATMGDHIQGAFTLFWADASAAGNRLRSAAEQLLTLLGVKRFELRNKKGGGKRRAFVGIANRIEILRRKRPELAKRLDAIKWIGHVGSHSAALTRADILDGFEIFDIILEELYDDKAKRVGKITDSIVRRKRPRSVLPKKRQRV